MDRDGGVSRRQILLGAGAGGVAGLAGLAWYSKSGGSPGQGTETPSSTPGTPRTETEQTPTTTTKEPAQNEPGDISAFEDDLPADMYDRLDAAVTVSDGAVRVDLKELVEYGTLVDADEVWRNNRFEPLTDGGEAFPWAVFGPQTEYGESLFRCGGVYRTSDTATYIAPGTESIKDTTVDADGLVYEGETVEGDPFFDIGSAIGDHPDIQEAYMTAGFSKNADGGFNVTYFAAFDGQYWDYLNSLKDDYSKITGFSWATVDTEEQIQQSAFHPRKIADNVYADVFVQEDAFKHAADGGRAGARVGFQVEGYEIPHLPVLSFRA